MINISYILRHFLAVSARDDFQDSASGPRNLLANKIVDSDDLGLRMVIAGQ